MPVAKFSAATLDGALLHDLRPPAPTAAVRLPAPDPAVAPARALAGPVLAALTGRQRGHELEQQLATVLRQAREQVAREEAEAAARRAQALREVSVEVAAVLRAADHEAASLRAVAEGLRAGGGRPAGGGPTGHGVDGGPPTVDALTG